MTPPDNTDTTDSPGLRTRLFKWITGLLSRFYLFRLYFQADNIKAEFEDKQRRRVEAILPEATQNASFRDDLQPLLKAWTAYRLARKRLFPDDRIGFIVSLVAAILPLFLTGWSSFIWNAPDWIFVPQLLAQYIWSSVLVLAYAISLPVFISFIIPLNPFQRLLGVLSPLLVTVVLMGLFLLDVISIRGTLFLWMGHISSLIILLFLLIVYYIAFLVSDYVDTAWKRNQPDTFVLNNLLNAIEHLNQPDTQLKDFYTKKQLVQHINQIANRIEFHFPQALDIDAPRFKETMQQHAQAIRQYKHAIYTPKADSRDYLRQEFKQLLTILIRGDWDSLPRLSADDVPPVEKPSFVERLGIAFRQVILIAVLVGLIALQLPAFDIDNPLINSLSGLSVFMLVNIVLSRVGMDSGDLKNISDVLPSFGTRNP